MLHIILTCKESVMLSKQINFWSVSCILMVLQLLDLHTILKSFNIYVLF